MSSSQVEEAEITLTKSANMTTVNGTTTGGANTTNAVTGLVAGEWWPRMSSPSSGTLGTTYNQQTQKVFVNNTNAYSKDLTDAFFSIDNLCDDPSSSDKIKFQGTSSDTGSKKVRTWQKVGSAVMVEDVILNGVTLVQGSNTVDKAYRGQVLATADNTPIALAGVLNGYIGAQQIMALAAGDGWFSSEIDLAMVATLDDTGTIAGREATPPGTYTRPWNQSVGLPITNSTSTNVLTATHSNGIWGRQQFACFLPPVAGLKLRCHLGGEST